MKKIQKLIDQIDDELKGATCYAEKYLEYKALGNSTYANRYKEMSSDELKHAMYIHDVATGLIKELGAVFTPPVEMEDEWEHSHKEYVEKSAWIKQMLSL